MKKLFFIFVGIFLLLAGCVFFQPTETTNANGISISNADQALLTKSKVADYSYLIKDKAGNPLVQDTVKNKIDKNTNTLLDCDKLSCDYKVEITAKQAQTFDVNALMGKYIGEGVSVQKIFYETFTITTAEYCNPYLNNVTGKTTEQCYNVTTATKNENIDVLKPFGKDETRTYVVRFTKDNTINADGTRRFNNQVVDIYHEIYGQERKDAAIWNSTGGSVFYDGNYTVVTFTANGTFNVTGSITNATVLVIAGGAAGGCDSGGGGGAGGLIYNLSQSLTGNYTVTVGAGGIGINGARGTTCWGANGTNSIFGTMTAVGGGGGVGYVNPGTYVGKAGGSAGGGGAVESGQPALGGTASPAGQGGNGGNGTNYAGGGGGGATANGSNAVANTGGNAGAGFTSTINGTSVCYAGGGAGGTSGGVAGGNATCGGGNGGKGGSPLGSNGTNGLGGGGGGTGWHSGQGTATQGSGGSGIVIIRYLTYINPPQLYIKTAINSYNGTNINYSFTGIVANNGATTMTNTNVSISANGTMLTSAVVNVTTGQIYTISVNWAVLRPTLDNNFTVSVSTTAAGDFGTGSDTAFMILPIDPPSAIVLKGAASGNLTVNATTGGSATGNNSTFTPPANLTINATASTGYYFKNWTVTTGNCSVLNASNPNTQIQVFNASQCNAQASFGANITVTYLAVLPNPPTLLDDLNCTGNITSVPYGSYNVCHEWYQNGVNMTAQAGCSIVANNTLAVISTLSHLVVLPDQNYSCRINAVNGTDSSGWITSANDTEPGSKSVNLVTTTGQPERFYLGDLPVSCKAPVNQTGGVGIYNVTNNGTATVNVVFSMNATFFGFDYTISNASTCASGLNMTTGNQTLYSGLAPGASQLFWAWANANTSLSIPPKFKIIAGAT